MQLNNKSIVLSFIVLASFVSCAPTKLKEDKYIKYVSEPKNGFLQEKKIGEVDIKLLQRPSCLVAGKDTSKQYKDNLYFNLSYSANNKEILTYNLSSFNDYSERLNILSFRMSQYVILVTDEYKKLRYKPEMKKLINQNVTFQYFDQLSLKIKVLSLSM